MRMNETLKPCPFCGSTKLKIESKRTFNYSKRHCSVTVRCMKCHARSPVVGINLDKNQHNERELCESQVTEAWNRRKDNG
jgi:Lar family restriction alleviation protein